MPKLGSFNVDENGLKGRVEAWAVTAEEHSEWQHAGEFSDDEDLGENVTAVDERAAFMQNLRNASRPVSETGESSD